MKMLERRTWSNLVCILLLFLTCTTIWQITTNPTADSKTTDSPNWFYTLYGSNTTPYVHPIRTLPTTDYHRLIDLNFTFNILNLVCNETSPFLLVVVHSASKNAAKRRTVRETWGQNSGQVRVVFMLGAVLDAKLQKDVEAESDTYGDLVQGNFLDTYRNMTYKHVMFFKYSVYHCPQAKYILKTDDDVFVHMPAMLNFLRLDLSPYGASRMLFCTPRKKTTPLRTYRSKWRVSFKEYPLKTYPTYCPGWVLLYSPDVVFNLYRESQRTSYFWIDDVHITGTLVQKIHVVHADIENLVLLWSKGNVRKILTGERLPTRPFLFGWPNMNESEIRKMWKFVVTHDPPKTLIKELDIYS